MCITVVQSYIPLFYNEYYSTALFNAFSIVNVFVISVIGASSGLSLYSCVFILLCVSLVTAYFGGFLADMVP